MTITKKAISTSVSNALDSLENNGAKGFIFHFRTVKDSSDTDEFLVWLVELSEQVEYRIATADCLKKEYVYKNFRASLIFLGKNTKFDETFILLFTESESDLDKKIFDLKQEIKQSEVDARYEIDVEDNFYNQIENE
jgi:hypothetical protein